MLSPSELRKRLETPEFVENNGGWGPFIFFIGVPTFIAIFGLVDPIFDWFLSLFSMEAGHIKTYWEVKYVLFFVFFLFMPISIYLLYMRVSPAHKRKAERAYSLITEEVSRIYAQMYDAPTPRHNLEKLHLVFHVDRKYGLQCESQISLIAKEDMHFWSYSVGSEAEGDGQEFVSDIGFFIKITGRECAFLPLKDALRDKEVMIAFLPYIKKNEKCDVSLSWRWPGCMGQLRDSGEEEYGWTCEGYDAISTGELYMEYVFDKKLGDIDCKNVGMSPAGAILRKDDRPNEIIWTFAVPQAPLGKGNQYRLLFKRH